MSKITAKMLSLLCLAAFASSGTALAESKTAGENSVATIGRCAAHQAHAVFLAKEFGEFPVFSGQVDGNVVLRLFANASSGSWTMLLVRTDGMSCIHGHGESGQRDVGS